VWFGELSSRHLLVIIVSIAMLAQYSLLQPIQTGAQLLNSNKTGWLGYDVEQAQSSPWLYGWDFRKAYNITGAMGAGANYQIELTVNYDVGNDSGGVLYCGRLCKPDFGDIRFTDNDGLTLLHCWQQTSVPFDHAIFWVQVADDLSSSATIYVYYGNTAATSDSDADATFRFCDDFSSGLDKWNLTEFGQGTQAHTLDSANGKLHVHAESSAANVTSGYLLETKQSFSSLGAWGFCVFATASWDNLTEEHSAVGLIQCIELYDGHKTCWAIGLSGIQNIMISLYVDNDIPLTTYNQSLYRSGTSWFRYYVDCSPQVIDMQYGWNHPPLAGGEALEWLTNFTLSSYKIRLWAIVQSSSGLVKVDSYYDHVFLAKWTPDWTGGGSWGAEEIWDSKESGQQAVLPMNIASAIVTIGSFAVIVIFSTKIYKFRRDSRTAPLQRESNTDKAINSHRPDRWFVM